VLRARPGEQHGTRLDEREDDSFCPGCRPQHGTVAGGLSEPSAVARGR
jgi:hypothetical protein